VTFKHLLTAPALAPEHATLSHLKSIFDHTYLKLTYMQAELALAAYISQIAHNETLSTISLKNLQKSFPQYMPIGGGGGAIVLTNIPASC
jgi:hypothetical protein